VARKIIPEELSAYLSKIGKKGGKRRLDTMTPEERSAVAKKAAAKSAEVRAKKTVAKRAVLKPHPRNSD
jgi:hypothetical protein